MPLELRRYFPVRVAIALALAVLLYLVSRSNYPLFHSIADMATVFIAGSVFLVVWNGRRHLDNHYYLFIAIAFLAFAVLDFMHLIGNKGMGVFPQYGSLGPTFYIASRYVLGVSFLLAPLFIKRKVRTVPVFAAYLLVVALVLLSVLHWRNFPTTYIEGTGLTPFKVYSDYAVCLILLGGLALLLLNRRAFDDRVFRIIALSLVFSIATGLAFTLYADPFGITNAVGHFFQIASFYLIYIGVVETVLTKPQDILYRNLKQSSDSVLKLNAELEDLNLSLNLDIAARKRAEAGLETAVGRFHSTLASLHGGVLLVSDQGKVEFANQSLCDLFALASAPRDLIGLATGDIIERIKNSYADPEAAVVRIRDIVANGEPVKGEEIALSEGRTCLRDFIPLQLSNGRHGSVWDHIDITDRKKAEEDLGRMRNILAEAERIAHLGSFEYIADTQTTLWSEEEFRIYGLDPAAQSPTYEVLLAKHIHPGDVALLIETFTKALQSGSVYELEHRIIRPDGSVRVVYDRAQPHFDENGKLVRYVGATLDVTERKRAEEALATAYWQTQSIIDNTPALVYACDLDARFTMVSRAVADLLKSTPERMIGKTRHEFMPKEDADWHEANDRQVIEAGKALAFEEYNRLQGRSITWLTTKFPLRDSQGRIYAVAGISSDITERKRAEAALGQLNETLEQRVAERTGEVRQQADQLRALANDLSQTEQRERERLAKILHDSIQQLLVAARMQLGLIKKADPKVIQSTVQGVDGILAETLDASRSLTVELCPPVLHLSGLAAGLTWLAARMEAKQQFKVHLRANTDAEPANADERAFLFDAVREILLNAAKHSCAREASVMMMRTRDDGCRIIVEDKGHGFDPASVKPGPSGGFGLFSIQQRLVYMGGKLEIESAPGQGTRAVLTVPISHAAAPEAALAAPSTEGVTAPVSFKQKGQRISILLVDDHKIMRQGLSSILQFENDMEVVAEAENGRQALERARQHKPDVVIMDVNMPVMGGIEATKILTSDMPQVKVIGLSMHLDGEAANAMREAGAVAFLTKGGPSEDLVETIRASVRRQPARS